jgi:hypothetical protein
MFSSSCVETAAAAAPRHALNAARAERRKKSVSALRARNARSAPRAASRSRHFPSAWFSEVCRAFGSKSSARAVARRAERLSSSAASPRNAAASPAAAVVAARSVETSVPDSGSTPATRGVSRSSATRRESMPAPRAVSSAPAAVFADGATEPNAASPSAPVHALARASQKRFLGDGSSEGVMVAPVAGESARAASKGPAGVTSSEASFAPPTAGTVGVDVAISRRVERRARGCAMDVPNGGFVSRQACLNPRNHPA